jgi:hypothetical protein
MEKLPLEKLPLEKLPLEKLPLDILKMIASYIVPKEFQLNPNINPDDISVYFLNKNPCKKIVETVISKPRMNHDDVLAGKKVDEKLILTATDFFFLSLNTLDMAVDFLLQKENQKNITLYNFSSNSNPKAVEYMLSKPEYIDDNYIEWYAFSENNNQKAVEFLIANPDKIRWAKFSSNNNQTAVNYLLAHQESINYNAFNANNNQDAVNHLMENQDKIVMSILVKNTNDTAVDYILARINELNETEKQTFFRNNFNIFLNSNDRIVDCLLENSKNILWGYFIRNTSSKAINYIVLPENRENINWNIFSTNPSIFREMLNQEAIIELALSLTEIKN